MLRIERIVGTLMRSLVEAAVAASRTSEQIAECLNREGFRPVSNRKDRFTRARGNWSTDSGSVPDAGRRSRSGLRSGGSATWRTRLA
jgi:hypothetical protein